MAEPLLIAQNAQMQCHLLPGLANRHGLITGATGTGKTVTLQTLAEQFSNIGVPVFMADVKGDLTGISQMGSFGDKISKVLQDRGLTLPTPQACPTTLWDVFGEQGHPVRATVSDMGPLLLARMLDLNDTQAGVLNLVFKIADDNGLLLLDMKDLRAMLQHVGENAKQFTTEYGNISAASVGAIQRGLMQIEQQGGDQFFGEPMLDIQDLMQTVGGKGVINILTADKLMNAPRLYATFLLWLLSELFEQLPEIGDPEKPKLVFFFDEAHLLFNDAPKVLIERIAQTMRPKAGLDIEAAITELAVGEALVSLLDAKGRPSETERVYVLPPGSQLGPITPQQRQALIQGSLVAGVYEKVVDRESAYEVFNARMGVRTAEAPASSAASVKTPRIPGAAQQETAKEGGGGLGGMLNEALFGRTGPRGGQYDGLVQTMTKTAARSVASGLGRQLVRGILGSLMGGKR